MDSRTLGLFLSYGSLILLLPIGIGLKRYRCITEAAKTIVWLFIFSLIIAVLNHLKAMERSSNHHFINFYTIGEFLFLARIYYLLLKGFINDLIIPVVSVLFTLFALWSIIFVEGIYVLNNAVFTTASIIVLLFSLTYFFKLIKEMKVQRLELHDMFWFNAGVLIYFSGSIAIFSNVYNLYNFSSQFGEKAVVIHAFLYFFWVLASAIALWLSRKA